MTVSKELIAAYADGELEGQALREVEAAIAADPELQIQVQAHRALRARLAAHFAPLLDRPAPDRLTDLLAKTLPEDDVQDNVVDFAAASRARAKPAAPRWRWVGPALAASLVLTFVGFGVSQRSVHDYAEGDVAVALDRQLVATQPAGAPVRILLSFRDGEGRFCRGFSSAAGTGIACRDGRGWKLGKVLGGGAAASGEYRQAGSADAEIMAAIQDLAEGSALDQQGERQAMRAGWRSR